MKSPAYILFLTPLILGLLLAFQPSVETRGAEWQSQTMVRPGGGAMPLLPFIDYYIDESRGMDVEELSAPALAAEFKPLVLSQLPRLEGVCWLRFTIAPITPESRPGAFLLDMGQSFPGVPVLYYPERNELSGALEWQEKSPSQRNIMLLPEEGAQAITCYIKIDGLPGPWFAPMIRTPQNAASNLSSLARGAAILALGVVMFICLLRGLGEKGQWRIWTALFVAVALAQSLLGMPAISAKFSLTSLAAVLAPGIALMLLPHVGRHLMQTPYHSKNLDIQLFLLSLPGAAIALWPLIPGWSWLDRWVDVWPICILIFVPTSLGAWIMGLGGARRFLTACLIPPLFTGIALAGLDFGLPPDILSSGPIWGLALCALLIAATRSPLLPADKPKKSPAKKEKTKDSSPLEDVISLEHPLDDPNLRLLPTREMEPPAAYDQQEAPVIENTPPAPEHSQTLEEREIALRSPLDEILRQGAALGQCSLPPAVRQYAENMISAAYTLADIISGEKAPSTSEPPVRRAPAQNGPFSLQKLLRNVHDSVSSFAESAGTALSWYVPPSLGRLYHGNEEELENILHLLLESSVRASKNGSVHLSARRVPGSDDPGHILFSITDNGVGTPPKDRSSLAISRAWEFIGRHGGYLAMEAGPNGVDIALSLRLPVEGEEERQNKAGNHILLASDNTQRRRELAQALEQLPCRVSQLGSAQEVLVCQSMDPSGLLIAHGQLARPSAADTIHKFSNLAHEAGLAKVFVLAITDDDKQWHLLKLSGFTHAMQEPEDLETLKDTINALLQALRENQNPPASQETDQNTSSPKADSAQNSRDESDLQENLFIAYGANTKSAGIKPAETSPPTAPTLDLGKVSQDGEDSLSPFEGPEWLETPDKANKAKNSPSSSLYIPTSPAEGMAQDKAAPAQYAGENSLNPINTAEFQGAPDSDDAQKPYNSIMEFIIGEEDKEETGRTGGEADLFQQEESDAGNSLSRPNSVHGGDEGLAAESMTNEKGKSDGDGDPVVQALIRELDDAMAAASTAYEGHDSAGVAEATGRIIREAENVGLRLLARMATCVERAAKENDMNALSDLLPELILAVERNRLALNQNRREHSQYQ